MNWIKTNGAENVLEHWQCVAVWLPGCSEWKKAWRDGDAWADERGERIEADEVSHYCEIAPPGEVVAEPRPDYPLINNGRWVSSGGIVYNDVDDSFTVQICTATGSTMNFPFDVADKIAVVLNGADNVPGEADDVQALIEYVKEHCVDMVGDRYSWKSPELEELIKKAEGAAND